MEMKLYSGKELAALAPQNFEINEVELFGENVFELLDLAYGPVIYESKKEGVEPFLEEIFCVKSEDLPDGISYEITAVIL